MSGDTGERHIDIVQRGFTAFNAEDFEGVVDLLDPEMVWDMSNGIPDGRVYIGHEGFRRFVSDAFKLWDVFQLEPEEYRAVEDRVLVTGWVELRSRALQLPVRTQWAWLWTLSDDKGIELRNYIRWEDAMADLELAIA